MKLLRNVLFALVAAVLLPTALVVLLANRDTPDLPSVDRTDPTAWDRGYEALRRGDARNAYELLRQVPQEHPDYARAMRYCGWNLLARELGRPKDAVAYVHESLRRDPFDGNVWEDLARVYVKSAFPFVDV